MQPFRELSSLTQNGIFNHIPVVHSDSVIGNYQKYNGSRGSMATTAEPFVPRTNHAHGSVHHGSHHHHPAQNNLNHFPQTPINQESNQTPRVWDVWSSNFLEGMRLVRRLAKEARFVAVDTEFPGVVAKVFGEYSNTFEQAYHNIKVNIDILKPIQIGFSFFNDRGQFVDTVSTVQFNMKWNVDNETHAADSIQLLEMSGIDFNKLKQNGIALHDFAEAFLASGLALNEHITWIGFHSAYDFAYMMKICTDWFHMPDNFNDFQKLLVLFFPKIVDLKAVVSEHKFPKGGLQELADIMHVPRIGAQHQAGSDAMLTGETFFRFLEEFNKGKLDPKVVNFVYGLNYCPNGVNNQSIPMNTLGLFSSELDSNFAEKSGVNGVSCRNATHSADQSGRNSPADSTSGHRSS